MSRLVMVSAVAMLLLPVLADGGNRPMVEKSVEDLGALNNEAVKKISELPRDGTVDLKAYVTMDGKTPTIRIEEQQVQIKGTGKQISPTPEGVDVSVSAVDGTIDFKEINRSGGDNVQQKNR